MKVLWIMPYKISEDQKKDLSAIFQQIEIVEMPEPIRNIWRDISPYTERIDKEIKSVKHWAFNTPDDTVAVIQGEIAATYHLVKTLQDYGIRCFSPTSTKVINRDGYVDDKHILFREYL